MFWYHRNVRKSDMWSARNYWLYDSTALIVLEQPNRTCYNKRAKFAREKIVH